MSGVAEAMRRLALDLIRQLEEEPLDPCEFLGGVAAVALLAYSDAKQLDEDGLKGFLIGVVASVASQVVRDGYIEDSLVAAMLERPDEIPRAAADAAAEVRGIVRRAREEGRGDA